MKILSKIKNFFSRSKEGHKSSSRKSIMLRWAFANTIFCFATFTIFAVLIYQMTVTTIINEEKSSMISAMDNVERALSKSDTPLTLSNLRNYLEYSSTPADSNVLAGEAPVTQTQTLGSMIGSHRAFYVYDIHGNLIYSTSTSAYTFELMGTGESEIREYSGEHPGYLAERRIVSANTGETIGYMQSFYNTSVYHNVRDKLFIALIILEILALIIAQVVGYFMASHFLKPLETLHQAMLSVAKDPGEEFKPIELKTGDEIEELAKVYNDMMLKTNKYVEQQKRFVSDASHELRTPLAVIDGHLNLLNRWGKNDPEILQESLEVSIEESHRMKTMLEEMLALSRLENLNLEVENLDCDPVRVCEFLVKNFHLLHDDFEIKFINQLQSAAHMKIYENHYEQAMTILVDNAIKYSPAERKFIEICLTEDDKFIITRVTDHGLGISEGDVSHIFERFFRADKARNREIGGTGLGLSIISRLVESYAGEIAVSSELGVGSTFTFKIPKLLTETD